MALDGENIVIFDEECEIGRLPLHNLEGIVSFGYRGTSPALMGACAEKNISLCYVTPQGKFLARVTGNIHGNVILREQQYKTSTDENRSLEIARNCIEGKIYNGRWVLERVVRDHGMQVNSEKIKRVSEQMKQSLELVRDSKSKDNLRGIEGEAAKLYFSVFDEMILQQKKDFVFEKRNRRPPLDNVNAVSYTHLVLQYIPMQLIRCMGRE